MMLLEALLMMKPITTKKITYQFDKTPPSGLTESQLQQALQWFGPTTYEAPGTVTPQWTIDSSDAYWTLSDGSTWYVTGVTPTTVENATTDLTFTLTTYYQEYHPCLDADCQIMLADHNTVKFRDLKPTDKIMVFNHETGDWDAGSILWLPPVQTASEYWQLTFDDGQQINSIFNHRFFCVDTGRYEYTTDLLKKQVFHKDRIKFVQKIERICEPIEYRNCMSYYHMNFVADGFVTGCGFNNLYPIKNLKFVKCDRPVRPKTEFNVADKWYYGMRLAEQYSPASEIIPYIEWRDKHNDC